MKLKSEEDALGTRFREVTGWDTFKNGMQVLALCIVMGIFLFSIVLTLTHSADEFINWMGQLIFNIRNN